MPQDSFAVPYRRLIVLGMLLAALAGASNASSFRVPGESFVHKDWELACDNTRTCRAAGYQAQEEPGAVSVLLIRRAGPGAAVDARVQVGLYEEGTLPKSLALRIDGRDLGALRYAPEEGLAELSATQVDSLLHALLRESEIRFVGDEGRPHWFVSDQGAVAVLLKMDEFQGRLDTPGALVRRGVEDESKVLPPISAPLVRIPAIRPPEPGDARIAVDPQLRSALLAEVPEGQECMGLMPGEDEAPVDVSRLDDHTLIASVICWRGAYNAGAGHWLIEERAPYAPRLVTMDGNYLENGLIEASQKGRGVGDCVWLATWAWNGDLFVKAAESTTGMCRGVAPGGAWSLPTRVSKIVRD